MALLAGCSDNPMITEILETRQAPGVVAFSSFLRRGYQASTVAGDWVYIDGGQFSFLDDHGQTVYQLSSTLLAIDLSRNWTNATVVIQSIPKPSGLPSLNYPSLWYHESEDLLYTGFTGSESGIGKQISHPLSLWSFKPDGTGSGTWDQVIDSKSSVWGPLVRPAAPLMAYSANTALVLGGDREFFKPVSPQTLMSGMVEFDMGSRSFVNRSAPCCNATGGIERGAMHYVPAFGPEGIFVAIGGLNGLTYNTTDGVIGFSTVSVFDPAKQEWWNQTTTGNAPSPRISFCTAGVASTNGTYEIFVYAGYGWLIGSNSIQYDTIHVLSLPAFHWFSVPYAPQHPRYGHTCNAVGGSQILTIGGVDAQAKAALPQPSNEFNNSADPFLQGLAVFDLNTMTFSDQFTVGAPPYEQSDTVKQYYAGARQGYLKNLIPEVSALLQVSHFTTSTNTITNSSFTESKPVAAKSNSGAIAGGTVAGVIVLLVVVISVMNFRNQIDASDITPESTDQEFPADKGLHEMHEDSRPPELGEEGFYELGEQTLQEMEQPRHRIELQGHSKPWEMPA